MGCRVVSRSGFRSRAPGPSSLPPRGPGSRSVSRTGCGSGSRCTAGVGTGPGLPGFRDSAQTLGLRLVACGDVAMHAPGRRPLLDTLTAIRLGVRVDEAGAALGQNRENHLRSRSRAGPLLSPGAARRDPGGRRRLPLLAGRAALRVPGRAGPGGHLPGGSPAAPDGGGRRPPLAGRHAAPGARPRSSTSWP